MLTLSESAATVLAQSRTEQGIPDDAVLRVAAAPSGSDQQQGISLGFVDQAADGDQTGTAHGMPLCVAPEVSDALDAAKIDVQTDGDNAQLVIVPVT